jgi:uncharacterized protein YciI
MPLFVLECRDKEGSSGAREDHLGAHREYLRARSVQVRLAGPLLDDQEQPIGSLVIVECESLDAARAFAASDPFSRAGVFQSVILREFQPE